MAEKDMPLDLSGGMDRADEVGMRHGLYGSELGFITVTPPKPTPRWLLKLRAIANRRQRSGAGPH